MHLLLLLVLSDALIATAEEPIKCERRRVCPDCLHGDFVWNTVFRNLLVHVRRLQEGLLIVVLQQRGRIYVFLLLTAFHQIEQLRVDVLLAGLLGSTNF